MEETSNFIKTIMADDLASGRVKEIITRFPPEPNAYLHIGHARAIITDFETAAAFGGKTNLRFDDTNPTKEKQEFVDAIIEDLKWLGYTPTNIFYGSDYFDATYEEAIKLIKKGLAYVDDLSQEEMSRMRDTNNGAGIPSPYRDRSVEENLALFEQMREGKFKDGEKIAKIKLTEIEPNRNQPRKKFDEESLEELANSIKEYGLIQPIVVAKKEDYYEIVAGERRWRASKKAGLKEVPVIIREDDERRNKEIALIENIQREDLNPIEKAMGIRSLMDEYGLTQQKVADILGKARSSIANTVRILNLDQRVIELALEGKLTEGHCKSLMAIEDNDKQYEMALYMIESGDSVREAEKKMQRTKKLKKKDRKYEAVYRDIENSFQSFFGTKVKLDVGKRKGKIVIEYANNEDLERILELVKK